MSSLSADEEYRSALQFIDHILSDEKEFERWANKVVNGWLKRRGYRRSSNS